MANSLAWYLDSGLTQQLSGPLAIEKDIDDPDPVDKVLYLGSTAANRVFVPDAGAQIEVGIEDSSPGGGDFEADDIALALSSGGLDAAVPGDPLDVGSQILSGVGNAVAVYIRFSGSAGQPVSSTELSLETSLTREYSV
jgi:hypothetical protein